jgi:hypothetical protein
VFLDLYYASRDNIIAYPDIKAYMETTRTELSIYETGIIRRMNSWAADEVYKAFRENQDA